MLSVCRVWVSSAGFRAGREKVWEPGGQLVRWLDVRRSAVKSTFPPTVAFNSSAKKGLGFQWSSSKGIPRSLSSVSYGVLFTTCPLRMCVRGEEEGHAILSATVVSLHGLLCVNTG